MLTFDRSRRPTEVPLVIQLPVDSPVSSDDCSIPVHVKHYILLSAGSHTTKDSSAVSSAVEMPLLSPQVFLILFKDCERVELDPAAHLMNGEAATFLGGRELCDEEPPVTLMTPGM